MYRHNEGQSNANDSREQADMMPRTGQPTSSSSVSPAYAVHPCIPCTHVVPDLRRVTGVVYKSHSQTVVSDQKGFDMMYRQVTALCPPYVFSFPLFF